MPLPPYIHERLDRPDRYQTVYAATSPVRRPRPTAGLHLTPELLTGIAAVGATIAPRRARRRPRHVPAGDRGRPARAPHAHRALPGARRRRGRRCRGGRARSSPSARRACGRSSRRPSTGAPRRAHRPVLAPRRSTFQVVDVLMTNFHLPRTTLLMMIDAFVGPRWRDLYDDRARRRLPLPVVRRRHAARPPRPVAFRAVHPVTVRRSRPSTARRAPGSRTTARGTYRTPCFMPVGTRGAVKYLSAADYDALGAEIVLGNTYHLMLRPGAEVVARFGGLGALHRLGRPHADRLAAGSRCSRWTRRSTTTASRSAASYDGSTHRLTPESAVATQELLGADIQMVLDVCPPLPSPPDVVELAVERTAAWAARARAAHRRDDQALFGIVQGGVDEALRADERQAHRRARLRRLRHRRAVGRRDARRDAAGARRGARPTCPPTGRAT